MPQDLPMPTPAVQRRPFPWWVSVALAAGLYSLLRFYLPTLQPEAPTLARLCGLAPSAAPLVAIPLLLLAAKQLYDQPLGGGGNPAERGSHPGSRPGPEATADDDARHH